MTSEWACQSALKGPAITTASVVKREPLICGGSGEKRANVFVHRWVGGWVGRRPEEPNTL